MSRRPLERNSILPYHVVARVNNRELFHLPLEKMWNVFGQECLNLHWVYGVEFQAAVLMPNHLHLLLTVPEFDLGKIMDVLMSSLTRSSNQKSGRRGHLFGGRYRGSLIGSVRYYSHALKYVYRNPVRAKICGRVEEYPYSTLRGLVGLAHLPFPIHYGRTVVELGLPSLEPLDWLEWLNEPFPKEAEIQIQKGLERRSFSEVRDRNTRRPIRILSQLI